MAEGGVHVNAAEKIHCSICLERFKNPKLLPCYHTFCVLCLDTYVGNNRRAINKFPCPLCRKEIEIPQGGVEKFQSNFYIETASIELSKDEVPCDICGPKASATHKCTDCEENLCTSCSEFHLKMKIARHHKLAELTALDSKTKCKLVTRVVCPEHPNEELKFVCKQCGDKLLCIDCKLTEHENHNTKHVTNEAKSLREELSRVLCGKTIDEQISKLRNQVSVKAKTVDNLNSSFRSDLEKIEQQALKMHECVDDIATDTKQNATKFYTTQLEKADTEMKQIEQKHHSCVSFRENVSLLLDHESDINILKKGSELRNAVETLTQPLETYSQVKYVRRFRPGNIDQEALKKLFGPFEENVSQKASRPILKGKESLQLLTSFELPHTFPVTGIAPTKNGKAWISCYDHGILYLVDIQGKIEKTVSIGGGCDFVTVNGDSECIVSCIGKKCISRVTSTGEVKTIIDNLHLYPHGLACMKGLHGTDELLYTCTNGKDFEGTNGCTKYVGRKDKTLATEAKLPLRVAVDPESGKMCIADYTNRKVTIHDREGVFISQYSMDNIKPCGVVFYETDTLDLLVCNYNEDIRLINLDGRRSGSTILLRGRFVSLAVDDSNRLWVGLTSGQIKVYQVQ